MDKTSKECNAPSDRLEIPSPKEIGLKNSGKDQVFFYENPFKRNSKVNRSSSQSLYIYIHTDIIMMKKNKELGDIDLVIKQMRKNLMKLKIGNEELRNGENTETNALTETNRHEDTLDYG